MLYFKFNELNFHFQEAEKSESNKRRKQKIIEKITEITKVQGTKITATASYRRNQTSGKS